MTTVLKALFGLGIGRYAYFKGGTSLSKGWNLINRFSEDIDIALYRDFLSEGEGCGLRPLREQQPDQAAAEGIA